MYLCTYNVYHGIIIVSLLYHYCISVPLGFSDVDQGDAKARNTMTFAPRALRMSRMWRCKPSWHGRNPSPLRRHLAIRQNRRGSKMSSVFFEICFNHGRISNQHVCCEDVTHLHHLLVSSRWRLFAATVLGTCL